MPKTAFTPRECSVRATRVAPVDGDKEVIEIKNLVALKNTILEEPLVVNGGGIKERPDLLFRW